MSLRGALQVAVLVLLGSTLRAQNATPVSITRAQHLRLPVSADIQRIAVGDGEISLAVSVEVAHRHRWINV